MNNYKSYIKFKLNTTHRGGDYENIIQQYKDKYIDKENFKYEGYELMFNSASKWLDKFHILDVDETNKQRNVINELHKIIADDEYYIFLVDGANIMYDLVEPVMEEIEKYHPYKKPLENADNRRDKFHYNKTRLFKMFDFITQNNIFYDSNLISKVLFIIIYPNNDNDMSELIKYDNYAYIKLGVACNDAKDHSMSNPGTCYIPYTKEATFRKIITIDNINYIEKNEADDIVLTYLYTRLYELRNKNIIHNVEQGINPQPNRTEDHKKIFVISNDKYEWYKYNSNINHTCMIVKSYHTKEIKSTISRCNYLDDALLKSNYIKEVISLQKKLFGDIDTAKTNFKEAIENELFGDIDTTKTNVNETIENELNEDEIGTRDYLMKRGVLLEKYKINTIDGINQYSHDIIEMIDKMNKTISKRIKKQEIYEPEITTLYQNFIEKCKTNYTTYLKSIDGITHLNASK